MIKNEYLANKTMHNIVYYKSKDYQLSIVCGRGFSKRVPTHRHKSVSLGMVLKGSRILTIHKLKYIIAEGDVFIINYNEPHSIGETQNLEHDYIVLSIAPALLLKSCGNNLPVFDNIVESTVLAEYLRKFFLFLIQKNNGIENSDIAVLIEEICCFQKKETAFKQQDKRLEKVRDILDNSIADNHSLTSLSDKAAVSAFHLARLFKNYTGMAPHQYLLDNRLRFAREMLESGQQISDIAIASGFYDTSHFIRHFSKYFGVSPFDYQKSINKLTIQ
jgi:AraC-like DNA-binding protein